MDPVVLWLTGDSGSGKTTLSTMVEEKFGRIVHLDLFPVHHIDKINEIEGIPDLWRYEFDVIDEETGFSRGNLNIAGYWNDMAEVDGAIEKAINLFFDIYTFEGVTLFEGWANEQMKEALLKGFEERNIRVWEIKRVTSGQSSSPRSQPGEGCETES